MVSLAYLVQNIVANFISPASQSIFFFGHGRQFLYFDRACLEDYDVLMAKPGGVNESPLIHCTSNFVVSFKKSKLHRLYAIVTSLSCFIHMTNIQDMLFFENRSCRRQNENEALRNPLVVTTIDACRTLLSYIHLLFHYNTT